MSVARSVVYRGLLHSIEPTIYRT